MPLPDLIFYGHCPPLSYPAHVCGLLQKLSSESGGPRLLMAPPKPWQPSWVQQLGWRRWAGQPATTVLFNAGSKPLRWPGPQVVCHTAQWTVAGTEQLVTERGFPALLPAPRAPENGGAVHSFFAAYAGEEIAGITALLKAFSQFLQWQKSAMHLHLLVTKAATRTALSELLATYKYRHQVLVLSEPTALLYGAYAYLHWAPPGQADALLHTALLHQTPTTANEAFAAVLPGLRTGDEAAKLMRVLYQEEALLAQEAEAWQQQLIDWPGLAAQEEALRQWLRSRVG